MFCVVESQYKDYKTSEKLSRKIRRERNNAGCFIVNKQSRDDNFYYPKLKIAGKRDLHLNKRLMSLSERSISVQCLNENTYLDNTTVQDSHLHIVNKA